MKPRGALCAIAALLMTTFALPLDTARAELALSQLVVELNSKMPARVDVEILNTGTDRTYVSVEPREILSPGTAAETARKDPDPETLGLLVSPARMILEPGQRKLLRIANIAPTNPVERVYRVTVKPVVGELATQVSGLKVLIGYDMLVLVRPSDPKPEINGTRSGDRLTLRNDSNVSVELVDGQECDASNICRPLPGGRLFAHAEKTVVVAAGNRVKYKLKLGSKMLGAEF